MTNSPVPSLSLETAVADLLPAFGRLVRRMRSELHHGGFNLSQMGTLALLERGGAATTADLARSEAMKPQSMGTILAGLEQQGLVRRRPHPSDGRQVLFMITRKGLEERKKRKIAKREWLVAAIARLEPAEQQTLIAAIPLIKRLAGI
jgi:DNA-binding MarR family transcriptional regulator